MNSQVAVSVSAHHRQQALQQLVQCWQAGDLSASFDLAKAITETTPSAGLAWKLLGVLYVQNGDVTQGISALLTAQKLMPKDTDVAFNLGNAYAKSSAYPQAITAYQKAIKLSPMFAQAYANLGSVYHLQHDLKAAQKALTQAVKYQPNAAFAYGELGLVIHKQGKPKEAIQFYRKAIAYNSRDAVSYYNLALALEDVGDDAQAEANYGHAIAQQAGYIDALFNLGYLHKRTQRYEEANACFTQILQQQPNHERALQVLADSYLERGDVEAFVDTYLRVVGDENAFTPEKLNDMVAMLLDKGLPNVAEKYCQMALEKAPDSPLILNNMGLICFSRNDPAAAVRYFEKAIAAKPDFVQAYSNGSLPFIKMGKVNEAIDYLQKAIAINPDYFAAYVNLGMAYSESGEIGRALASLEKALLIKPDNIKPIQSILFLSAYQREHINARYFELLTQFGELTAKQAKAATCWRIHPEDQRIKIGFVSGDLKHHPVGLFLKPVLQHLDQSQFDVYVYSNSVLEDKVTHELKTYVSQWQGISHLSDEMAARKIHEDGVHILIDLSGHTSLNRLPVFAWKPAPLQLSWLGYWASTGMPSIDYVMVDAVSVPTEQQAQFTEQVAYLPDTRLCFSQPAYDLPVSPLPALANGYITLGCYHKYTKATDEVLALWCAVLRALPTAKLRWQTTAFGDAKVIDTVQQRFAAHGIAATRCQFLPAAGIEQYLASHAEVDFILDTFPFTGGTTTCDALWMGVPTITLAGEHLIARQGASLMTAAGLDDWVVLDKHSYIEKAVAFATDLLALAALRGALRARLSTSALFNGERFTHGFGQLLARLWQTQQRQLTQAQYTAPVAIGTHAATTPLCVLAVTQYDAHAFWQQAPLGRSLHRQLQKDARLQAHIAFAHTGARATALNRLIAALPEDAMLLIVTEDVWLDEPALWQAVDSGLSQYDLFSVAGNRRRLPRQASWRVIDAQQTEDAPSQLVGSVRYGAQPFAKPTHFAHTHGACSVLNGALLATTKRALTSHALHFDPQFEHDCDDIDLCRAASNAGLQLGVWPLQVTQAPPTTTPQATWYQAYQTYLRKWEDANALVAMPLSAPLKQVVEEVFTHALNAHQQGDLTQAAALYQEILSIDSNHALALHNLAHIDWVPTATPQQLEIALQRFQLAYQLAPATWQCFSSYVTALIQVGHTEMAAQVLASANQFDADTLAPLQSQLAAAQALDMSDSQVGGETQQPVVQVATDPPAALAPTEDAQQACIQLFEQGDYAGVVDTLEQLLLSYPDWLNGWRMLADQLLLLKRDAKAAAQRALALNPKDAKEHCYYGVVLKTQGDFHGAANAFAQAVHLAPDYAAAWNNWGLVLKDMGMLSEAVVKFEQALHLQPGYAECFSNVLFCLSHIDAISNAELLQLHQLFAERYESPLVAQWPQPRPVDNPQKVLHIGFVSADFRAHSMAHFLLPVLPLLAKQSRFKLFAYANQGLSDAVTAEMQSHVTAWRSVDQLSDDALAALIRKDGIDLLIDLSGHTAGNRLLTFARKPAPIQLSWLGYLHSTGLTAMDYYLVDVRAAPQGLLDHQFTEKLLPLPCEPAFQPYANAPAITPLPALQNGYLTFACFNRPEKITPSTIALWGALLRQLPDSRLWLGGMGTPESSQLIVAGLADQGIAAERVRLLARTDMETYCQQLQGVDVCLDTVPSSGVTTTLHAMWMGVPTLCLAGESLRSRGAMTHMLNAGLDAFVANDSDDFVRKGVAITLAQLVQIRSSLRTHMQAKQPRVNQALCDALVATFESVWAAHVNATQHCNAATPRLIG